MSSLVKTYRHLRSATTYLGKAGLIPKIEEAPYAILAGLKVEILNESKSGNMNQRQCEEMAGEGYIPFA